MIYALIKGLNTNQSLVPDVYLTQNIMILSPESFRDVKNETLRDKEI